MGSEGNGKKKLYEALCPSWRFLRFSSNVIKKLLDMKAVGGWTRRVGTGESIHSYSSLTVNSIRFERSIAENLIGSYEKKRSFPDQRLGPNFLLKKLGKKSSWRFFL